MTTIRNTIIVCLLTTFVAWISPARGAAPAPLTGPPVISIRDIPQ